MKFFKLFSFIKSSKFEEKFAIELMAKKSVIKEYVLSNRDSIIESMPNCSPTLALTMSASNFIKLADFRYKPTYYKSFNEDGDVMYWAYLANTCDKEQSIVINLNNYDSKGIVMYFSDELKLYDNEGNAITTNNLEILDYIRYLYDDIGARVL